VQKSLLIPLVLSIAVHAAVIGVGELLYSSGDGGEGEPSVIAYDTSVAKAEKEPAVQPDRDAGGGTSGTVSLETSNPLYRPYFDRIRDDIARSWKPPAGKGGAAAAGRLIVLFTLDRDGALLDISVETSSGDREKDFAATRAVKSSAPYGAFPPEISDDRLAVRARFVSP
jgi:TonB family protein